MNSITRAYINNNSGTCFYVCQTNLCNITNWFAYYGKQRTGIYQIESIFPLFYLKEKWSINKYAGVDYCFDITFYGQDSLEEVA